MVSKGSNVFILAVFSLVPLGFCQNSYSPKEEDLISDILRNYSRDARPSPKTIVIARLILFAINQIDIGQEVMSISGILYLEWVDSRLRWDPDVEGLTSVVTRSEYLWLPPMIIENEVNKVGMLGREVVPIRIMSNGTVLWTPPLVTTTTCPADITYYPYDKQECSITVVGWTYTINEVDIIPDMFTPVDNSHLSENGEWELLDKSFTMVNLTDAKLQMTFRKTLFTVKVRRRWPYYGQNIMLPVILNSILAAFAFRLPLESGEKMSYCLTVLLSFVVLLTMVSANLPSISNQTSVIQMYLSIVLCLCGAATLCSMAVLNLYHRDQKKPVPPWFLVLVRYCLAPLSCKGRNHARVPPEPVLNSDHTKTSEHSPMHKEIAEILDGFFFTLFSLTIFVMTTAFIVKLINNN